MVSRLLWVISWAAEFIAASDGMVGSIKGPLAAIPVEIRRDAAHQLIEREEKRRQKLFRDEKEIKNRRGLSSENAAREISRRHLKNLEENFQDKIKTWAPLVREYAPEQLPQLREHILKQKPYDPLLPPDVMRRFIRSRLATFDRYLNPAKDRRETHERMMNAGTPAKKRKESQSQDHE
jgi:hypothetical protein